MLHAGLVMRADHDGVTPLHEAARLDQVDLAVSLLKNSEPSVFLNARTAAGNTPLMLASYHGSGGMVRYLLDAGVPVGEQNAVGDTALHLAARQGNYPAALLLVEAGASLNQRNGVAQSSRSIIESTNDPRWVELLTRGPSDMQRLLQRISQN